MKAIENKVVDTRQNFNIKPIQELHNSVTKKIGEGAKSPIANKIDEKPLYQASVYVKKQNDNLITRANANGFGSASLSATNTSFNKRFAVE